MHNKVACFNLFPFLFNLFASFVYFAYTYTLNLFHIQLIIKLKVNNIFLSIRISCVFLQRTKNCLKVSCLLCCCCCYSKTEFFIGSINDHHGFRLIQNICMYKNVWKNIVNSSAEKCRSHFTEIWIVQCHVCFLMRKTFFFQRRKKKLQTNKSIFQLVTKQQKNPNETIACAGWGKQEREREMNTEDKHWCIGCRVISHSEFISFSNFY